MNAFDQHEAAFASTLNSRPPLGVMPHDIWIEKRRLELSRAILRQFEHHLEHPFYDPLPNVKPWVEELQLLL